MVVALRFVVLQCEVLEGGSELVVEEVFDDHLTCDGFFQLRDSGLLDHFLQIFVFESHPHFFLLEVFLQIILLPN